MVTMRQLRERRRSPKARTTKAAKGRSAKVASNKTRTVKVWMYPHPPRSHWTPKAQMVLDRLGWIRGTREDHDLRVYFSNWTIDRDGVLFDRNGKRAGATTVVLPKTINGGCTDVSKKRTEEIFLKVFGYSSLAEDGEPSLWKGDVQALKQVSVEPVEGWLKMKDIDTRTNRGTYVDLRPLFIDGTCVGVFVKEKTHKVKSIIAKCAYVEPSSVFSKSEIADLAAYSTAFGLDFGELDVLRDNKSTRIYVVDVNPTTNTDVDLAAIQKRSGLGKRREIEERIAQAFADAFSRPKWLVR